MGACQPALSRQPYDAFRQDASPDVPAINSHTSAYHTRRSLDHCDWAQHNCVGPSELICGTALQNHRDPTHDMISMGIKGGALDVNGDGHLDWEDCVLAGNMHPATVDMAPVPDTSQLVFQDIQTRHAVARAAEALEVDPTLGPREFEQLAKSARLNPHDLHRTAQHMADEAKRHSRQHAVVTETELSTDPSTSQQNWAQAAEWMPANRSQKSKTMTMMI